MFRLRSKSGDESVFRTTEEIRAALLSGFVTPDAQIWDAELKGWVPLLEHSLYQQIAANPAGRKSGAVKAPPASPTTAKPVPKLVIRRPGEATPPVTPPPPPTPPPAPMAPAANESPELEMLDVDLSFEPEPVLTPPPAPTPPPVAAVPPPRPTPPPAPPAPPAAAPPPPRVSAPRPAPQPERVSRPAEAVEEEEPTVEGGSKKGLIIAAVVVLAAAGGGFAMLRGRGAELPAQPDTAAVATPIALVDSAPDSTAAPDSAGVDSTTPAAAVVDTAKPVAVDSVPPDTTPAAPTIPGVAFAPPIERGFTSWNARPATAQALSVPELEAVRLRYIASQSRALEQFEAGLAATGFSDMFDAARISRQDRREEALEAVEAGREGVQNFRRRQAAIDFAYTDSLRQILPAGSDDPDLRTFGPLLRETPAQAALTDSLLTEINDIYTLLVNTPGGYTFRNRELFFKDAAKADRYRVLQERLTAQLGRLKSRPGTEIPPAMGGILRGIGLPR